MDSTGRASSVDSGSRFAPAFALKTRDFKKIVDFGKTRPIFASQKRSAADRCPHPCQNPLTLIAHSIMERIYRVLTELKREHLKRDGPTAVTLPFRIGLKGNSFGLSAPLLRLSGMGRPPNGRGSQKTCLMTSAGFRDKNRASDSGIKMGNPRNRIVWARGFLCL